MKHFFVSIMLVLLAGLQAPVRVAAQADEEPLIVSLNKDFGYAAGGKIQGTFSLKIRTPDDLLRVDFYVDDELVFVADAPPFQYQFNTTDYALGEHTFRAVGYRSDGAQLVSSIFSREFISAEQAWENVGALLGPLLGVVVVLTLLGTGGSALLGRKREFRLGQYGIVGGAVCPRCTLPYARSLFAPNLLVGKLQRCPHCGKWAIVAGASPDALAQAEERYRTEGSSDVSLSDQQAEFQQVLHDSRYEHDD